MILQAFTFLVHNALPLIAGLIGLNFLVVFHELGHFLFCKLFKIRTVMFSIGFGPILASKKIGETLFAISSIPLGGFVEIAGSAEVGQGEQKDAHARDKHSFAVKPYWQKFLVLMGGILFNFIFAYFALILIFLIGIPKTKFLYPHNALPVIATIAPESAAEKAKLLAGDRIIQIDGTFIDQNVLLAHRLINAIPGKETTIVIDRNGKEITIPVTLESKGAPGKSTGSLGVTFEITEIQGLSFGDALKQGVYLTTEYIKQTAFALKNIFAKRDVSGLGGPLMIISQTAQAASQSFVVCLFFLAIISINLAVFNFIPLPILDGGQILYYTIEAIIRKPLPMKVREYIHIATWLFMLALVLYLSAQDIYMMIKPLFIKTVAG